MKHDLASIEQRFSKAFADCLAQCPTRKLGVAVSGGSDSIALMHLALRECGRLGIEMTVLSFDHAIRGENSAAEARFVRRCAARLGIPAMVERADPPVTAGRGKSLEMAAREARMAFFLRSQKALGLDAIATAHQRDDAAELLLLRLLRGAGMTGLSGLCPVTADIPGHPRIIRPLLDFQREELRAWLKKERIRWMDDVANSNLNIPRCRVRLRLIPEMARIMGRPREEIIAALAQSASILRDEDRYIEAVAEQSSATGDETPEGIRHYLNIAHLGRTGPAIARRVARAWLLREAGDKAIAFDAVERLLAAGPSSAVNLPGGAVVEIDRSRLARIRMPAPAAEAPPPAAVPLQRRIVWGGYSIYARRTAAVSKSRRPPCEWPASCTLSADALAARGPLSVRARREHDRMTPFGIDGSKSLQDIFVDAKIPSAARETWPVFCAGDEIAWIPGYRIAAQFAVPPGGKAVQITVKEVEP